MPGRPPVYTFRRPRKSPKKIFPVSDQTEMYTRLDDIDESESTTDQISRYTRYSFFVLFTILILMVLAGVYISQRGLPAKVRA